MDYKNAKEISCDARVLLALKETTGTTPLVVIGIPEEKNGISVVIMTAWPGVNLQEMTDELSVVMEKYMIQSGAHIQARNSDPSQWPTVN